MPTKKKRPRPQPKPKKQPRVVDKKPAFLAAFARTASLTKAAELVKITRSTHYDWHRDSEEYRAAFAAAREQAAQTLEDEAIRRAHEGVPEPLVYQGQFTYRMVDVTDDETGEVIGQRRTDEPLCVHKYSDSLLQFLLKGFRPERYKDRAAVEHSGPGGAPIPVDARLSALDDTEIEQLRSIAEKLTSARDDRGGNPPAQP